jgi:hypothetical protein
MRSYNPQWTKDEIAAWKVKQAEINARAKQAYYQGLAAHEWWRNPFANVDGLDSKMPRPPWKRPGLGLRSK